MKVEIPLMQVTYSPNCTVGAVGPNYNTTGMPTPFFCDGRNELLIIQPVIYLNCSDGRVDVQGMSRITNCWSGYDDDMVGFFDGKTFVLASRASTERCDRIFWGLDAMDPSIPCDIQLFSLRKRTVMTKTETISIESISFRQEKDSLVVTLYNQDNTSGGTICVASQDNGISPVCSELTGLEFESITSNILVFNKRVKVYLKLSIKGEVVEKTHYFYPLTYCEEPTCSYYMCTQSARYLYCSSLTVQYVAWAMFGLTVLLLLKAFMPLIVVIGLLIYKLLKKLYGWTASGMDKLKDTAKDELPKPSSSSARKNALLKAILIGMSLNGADACYGKDDRIWDTASFSTGLIIKSGLEMCRATQSGMNCDLQLALSASVSMTEGICLKFVANQIGNKELLPVEVTICPFEYKEVYTTTTEAIYGTPVLATRMDGRCPSNGNPDCLTGPPSDPYCATLYGSTSKSVGWSDCATIGTARICSVSTVRLTDLTTGFTVDNPRRVVKLAVLTRFSKVNDASGLEEYKEVKCIDSEELTFSDPVIDSVKIVGSLDSSNWVMPNGKKFLWRSEHPERLSIGDAASKYQGDYNGYGQWQTACLSESCDCGTKRFSGPDSPITLTSPRKVDGLWTADMTIKNPNDAAKNSEYIEDFFRDTHFATYNITVIDLVPILYFSLEPRTKPAQLVQINMIAESVKVMDFQACPVVGESWVSNDMVGSSKETVFCFNLMSSCGTSSVRFQNRGDGDLIDGQSCLASFANYTDCCLSIRLSKSSNEIDLLVKGKPDARVNVTITLRPDQILSGNSTGIGVDVTPGISKKDPFGFKLFSWKSTIVWVAIGTAVTIGLILILKKLWRARRPDKTNVD